MVAEVHAAAATGTGLRPMMSLQLGVQTCHMQYACTHGRTAVATTTLTAPATGTGRAQGGHVNVNVNVNNLLAISESDFDNSGEPGPQAEAVNHLETPLRQLHVTHRASSCAKRGGHVQLCSKPRGTHGIEPETFRRRGQLLSRPPTTGPKACWCTLSTGRPWAKARLCGHACHGHERPKQALRPQDHAHDQSDRDV